MDLKAKKMVDAAMYKTKFQSLWKGQYQFINTVPNDASSFHCTVCNKEISCAHQGERDVIGHTSADQHNKTSHAKAYFNLNLMQCYRKTR